MSNLKMRRGATETYTATCKTKTLTALNLTGLSLWFTVKQSLNDADAAAVVQKTVGSGITVADPLTGIAVVTINPADTVNAPGSPDAILNCKWDLQAKAGSSIVTLAEGDLELIPRVTRAT